MNYTLVFTDDINIETEQTDETTITYPMSIVKGEETNEENALKRFIIEKYFEYKKGDNTLKALKGQPIVKYIDTNYVDYVGRDIDYIASCLFKGYYFNTSTYEGQVIEEPRNEEGNFKAVLIRNGHLVYQGFLDNIKKILVDGDVVIRGELNNDETAIVINEQPVGEEAREAIDEERQALQDALEQARQTAAQAEARAAEATRRAAEAEAARQEAQTAREQEVERAIGAEEAREAAERRVEEAREAAREAAQTARARAEQAAEGRVEEAREAAERRVREELQRAAREAIERARAEVNTNRDQALRDAAVDVIVEKANRTMDDMEIDEIAELMRNVATIQAVNVVNANDEIGQNQIIQAAQPQEGENVPVVDIDAADIAAEGQDDELARNIAGILIRKAAEAAVQREVAEEQTQEQLIIDIVKRFVEEIIRAERDQEVGALQTVIQESQQGRDEARRVAQTAEAQRARRATEVGQLRETIQELRENIYEAETRAAQAQAAAEALRAAREEAEAAETRAADAETRAAQAEAARQEVEGTREAIDEAERRAEAAERRATEARQELEEGRRAAEARAEEVERIARETEQRISTETAQREEAERRAAQAQRAAEETIERVRQEAEAQAETRAVEAARRAAERAQRAARIARIAAETAARQAIDEATRRAAQAEERAEAAEAAARQAEEERAAFEELLRGERAVGQEQDIPQAEIVPVPSRGRRERRAAAAGVGNIDAEAERRLTILMDGVTASRIPLSKEEYISKAQRKVGLANGRKKIAEANGIERKNFRGYTEKIKPHVDNARIAARTAELALEKMRRSADIGKISKYFQVIDNEAQRTRTEAQLAAQRIYGGGNKTKKRKQRKLKQRTRKR